MPPQPPDADTQPDRFIAALNALRSVTPSGHRIAVFVIHLDRFSHACESFRPGTVALLRRIALDRVTGKLPRPGVAQWLEPADLGLILPLPEGIDYAQELAGLARDISLVLGRPFSVEGYEIFLSSSIGVAKDAPGRSTEHCLREAYDAMLQVRKQGGDGVRIAGGHEDPLPAQLLSVLPDAVARGELALHLQPRARLDTAEIDGYTVRLRWQNAELGRVAPQDFLPAVNALGLMPDVGRWLLQQALPLARTPVLNQRVQFALMVTSTQIRAPAVVDDLLAAIVRLGIQPGQFCIEVPVHALRMENQAAREALAVLREVGVHLTLSDVANDPAHLYWLDRLLPEMITLDARYLGSAGTLDAPRRLGEAAAYACRAGVAVCAKGIETQRQLAEVRDWGCTSIQGFLLAQPFPASWLEQTHLALQERARELLLPPSAPVR